MSSFYKVLNADLTSRNGGTYQWVIEHERCPEFVGADGLVCRAHLHYSVEHGSGLWFPAYGTGGMEAGEMSERLSRERLALYLRLIKGSADPNARATASFIEGHIAALDAENERLRAVRDVVGDFIRRGENRRTWRNLVKALAALEAEVGE